MGDIFGNQEERRQF
jgi:hypothetical protein